MENEIEAEGYFFFFCVRFPEKVVKCDFDWSKIRFFCENVFYFSTIFFSRKVTQSSLEKLSSAIRDFFGHTSKFIGLFSLCF